eukprot:CAMPEP_0181318810 /NCGR_PEP_ID=MMETSP1101-20121128/17210_1 /TAXON_ID=46948 /ORGANISM="Rhodomonas abbreviata, Strain Caron Lab Isolate" /LENGTH=437 /DNA_ID=CAMNT_0023426315 /DNA_START=128 /DNA_END=1441 /DNA_ORIENTATION=+
MLHPQFQERIRAAQPNGNAAMQERANRRAVVVLAAVSACFLAAVLGSRQGGSASVRMWQLAHRGQPISLQEASSSGTAEGGEAAASGKPACDSECEAKKQAAIARMKSLQDSIYHDFDSMINYGNAAGYIPPPESIEQQVKDGTLMTGGAASDAPPPPAFDAGSVEEVGAGAKSVQLDPSEVDAVKKQLSEASGKEQQNLEHAVDANVHSAEASVSAAFQPPGAVADAATAEQAPAASAPPSPLSLPPVTAYHQHHIDAAAAAAAEVIPSAAAAPPSQPSIISNPFSSAPAPAPAPAAAPAASAAPAAPAPIAPAAPAAPAAAIAPAAAAPAPAPIAPAAPAAPAFAAAPAVAAAPAAPAVQPVTAWDRAFAFIHQTDNPIVGGPQPALPATAATTTSSGAAPLAPVQGPASLSPPTSASNDPLKSDGFLKGFFGSV